MISVSNVTKLMNGIPLYSEASFQINPGEKTLLGLKREGKMCRWKMTAAFMSANNTKM